MIGKGRRLPTALLFAALALWALPPGEAAGATMALHLSGVNAQYGAGELGAFPVRTGVPMEPGAVFDATHVRLLVDGVETDLQTEVLARYNDRSVKWLLLDFVTTSGKKLVLEFGPAVRRKAVARPIRLSENADAVTVDTGLLKAVIRRAAGGFPDELHLDLNRDGRYAADERLPAPKGTRTHWMDVVHTPTIASRETMSASMTQGVLDPSRLEVTEMKAEVAGPLHAVVKVAGNYRYKQACRVTYPYTNPQYVDKRPKDMGRIPFVMHLHFRRGSAAIEVQHTFIWEGDPDRDFPTSLGLAVPMPTGPMTKILGPAETRAGNAAVIGISQLSADRYDTWRKSTGAAPGVVTSGKRAHGWMDISDDRWGVTTSVWRMWQNYPKAIHADFRTGALKAMLWPAEAGPMTFRRYARQWGVSETGARGGVDPFALSRHISRGAAKTHRVLFDFHPGRPAPAEVAPRTAWFRQKVRAWPSLEVMCSTRARRGATISPVEKGKYDDLEQIITDCFDWMLFNREHFRWYGMFDYGDLQQCFQNVHRHGRWESDYGRWGWFNGDASGNKPYTALLYHFLRTGRRDIFDMVEAEIFHIIDVDTVNCEEYPWNDEGWRDMRGCGHRHNAQHWACFYVGSRAMRIGTFSQLYYLTGDERLRDVLDIAAEAAWKELGEARASRGGHSGRQDMTSRLFYTVERTGDAKVKALAAEKWSWLLNGNRGLAELKAAEAEEDDMEWARKPARAALTVKRTYRYPGNVVGPLANGIRHLQDREDVSQYRTALDKAVEYMRDRRYRGGPQALPRDEWPGPPGGPLQGNWNGIPNHMPVAIHALKLNDAKREGGER